MFSVSPKQTPSNGVLVQIETHIKATETEIEKIRQSLTEDLSPEESNRMNMKLKATEERLWDLKVKISQKTKQWIGREESPC